MGLLESVKDGINGVSGASTNPRKRSTKKTVKKSTKKSTSKSARKTTTKSTKKGTKVSTKAATKDSLRKPVNGKRNKSGSTKVTGKKRTLKSGAKLEKSKQLKKSNKSKVSTKKSSQNSNKKSSSKKSYNKISKNKINAKLDKAKSKKNRNAMPGGLLKKAQAQRHDLLNKLTYVKKKYIDHVSDTQREQIQTGIKKQRQVLESGLGIKKKLTVISKKSENKQLSSATSESQKGVLAALDQEVIAKSTPLNKASGKKEKSTGGILSRLMNLGKSSKLKDSSKNNDGQAIIDMSMIKAEVERELKSGIDGKPIVLNKKQQYIRTGVTGFDQLMQFGIPQGASVLVAGGTGSGKTIFCLQTLQYHASHGRNCLYMSFEESEERLAQHMDDFGWKSKELLKSGKLLIKRFNPFDITRSVDALLLQAKGELLIDVDPVILPKNFKPDVIVVDSLTAIASAFSDKEDSYRIYIQQLFRFFEKINATSLLITETEQVPKIFSQTGVEEFLADGVFVLYAIKRGTMRENAIEILKLRGAKHQKKIVAMQITDKGVVVYPQQEIFGGLEDT